MDMKVSILPVKSIWNDAFVGVARDVIVRPFISELSGSTHCMIDFAMRRLDDRIRSCASINSADHQ